MMNLWQTLWAKSKCLDTYYQEVWYIHCTAEHLSDSLATFQWSCKGLFYDTFLLPPLSPPIPFWAVITDFHWLTLLLFNNALLFNVLKCIVHYCRCHEIFAQMRNIHMIIPFCVCYILYLKVIQSTLDIAEYLGVDNLSAISGFSAIASSVF